MMTAAPAPMAIRTIVESGGGVVLVGVVLVGVVVVGVVVGCVGGS